MRKYDNVYEVQEVEGKLEELRVLMKYFEKKGLISGRDRADLIDDLYDVHHEMRDNMKKGN